MTGTKPPGYWPSRKGVTDEAHIYLRANGFWRGTSTGLGLTSEDKLRDMCRAVALPQRGARGKNNARELVRYHRADRQLAQEPTNGVRDAPRFNLTAPYQHLDTMWAILDLIPPERRRDTGLMSVDYFRYGPGVTVGAHQDGFGDYITIWVLDRQGSGGNSFLDDLVRGYRVLGEPLAPGDVLIFEDDRFKHGVTPMPEPDASRDALIFISHKDA